MTLNGRMTVTTAVACVLVSTVLLPLFTNALWFVIGAGAVIAVIGRLSADDARQLAASRRGNAPAMALLLAVSEWATDGIAEDTARTAEILSAAGWRVAVATSGTPLATAWQQLHRPAETVTPYGGDQP